VVVSSNVLRSAGARFGDQLNDILVSPSASLQLRAGPLAGPA
jgi:hypothetical protein